MTWGRHDSGSLFGFNVLAIDFLDVMGACRFRDTALDPQGHLDSSRRDEIPPSLFSNLTEWRLNNILTWR